MFNKREDAKIKNVIDKMDKMDIDSLAMATQAKIPLQFDGKSIFGVLNGGKMTPDIINDYINIKEILKSDGKQEALDFINGEKEIIDFLLKYDKPLSKKMGLESLNEDVNMEVQDWKADLTEIKNRQKSENENFRKQFQDKKMTTKNKLDLAKLKLKHAQEMVRHYSAFPGNMNEGLTTAMSRRLEGLYKISSINGGKDNYDELKKIGVGGEFNYLGNLATVTKIEGDKIVALWHSQKGDRVMNIDKNGEITTGVLKSNSKIDKNGKLVESKKKKEIIWKIKNDKYNRSIRHIAGEGFYLYTGNKREKAGPFNHRGSLMDYYEIPTNTEFEEPQILNEKAASKSQQRLFGMAKALKSGDMKISDIKPEYRDDLKDIINTMTMKQISDFAGTKHKGLPDF